MTFEEYQQSEINCEVEGNPAPTVTWTLVDGQREAHTRTYGSRLIFDSPRKTDEGRYRCQAVNSLSRDEKYVQVYVQSSAPSLRRRVIASTSSRRTTMASPATLSS